MYIDYIVKGMWMLIFLYFGSRNLKAQALTVNKRTAYIQWEYYFSSPCIHLLFCCLPTTKQCDEGFSDNQTLL